MRLVGYHPLTLDRFYHFSYRKSSSRRGSEIYIGTVDYMVDPTPMGLLDRLSMRAIVYPPPIRLLDRLSMRARRAVSVPYGSHLTISTDVDSDSHSVRDSTWLECTTYHAIKSGHPVVYICGRDSCVDRSRLSLVSGCNAMDEYDIIHADDIPPESEFINMLMQNRISHIGAYSHTGELLSMMASSIFHEYIDHADAGRLSRSIIILDGVELTEDVVDVLSWLKRLEVSLIINRWSAKTEDIEYLIRSNIRYHIIM